MVDQSAVGSYRRAIQRAGQTVTFRRGSGVAPNVTFVDAVVKAKVRDASQEEIASGVKQNTRFIIVLAADLTAAGFTVPPVMTTDKILIQGQSCTIIDVDAVTREFAGAYDVTAIG